MHQMRVDFQGQAPACLFWLTAKNLDGLAVVVKNHVENKTRGLAPVGYSTKESLTQRRGDIATGSPFCLFFCKTFPEKLMNRSIT